MGESYDERTGEYHEWTDPTLEVDITDNPITHQLLDHHGNVIRQWQARPPIGFR